MKSTKFVKKRFIPQRKHRVFEGVSWSGLPAQAGKDCLRIIPLGGTGNVTKNMFVYEYRRSGVIRDILLVDCGIGFPDPEMYGVDLVIPDIRYLTNKKQFIRGLVFTHGHDDHIGATPYIYPFLGNVSMFGTTLTAAFANIKLKEARIQTAVKAVPFDTVLSLGPFRVSFVRMTHSVPDASNLVIETPVGVFYHGSDFKFDMTPLDGKVSELDKINAAGKKGVLCLLTDSLGSERPGQTPSERTISQTLDRELSLSGGKVLFTTQSSNISRIQLAIELALKHKRQIAFLGRSIDQNVEASVRLGYMRFPREALIRDRDLKRLPAVKQFLVVAGSQGQVDSALARIANDEHRFVHLAEGDTVIFSADPIPGHEKDVNALIDQIYHKGARVSYSDIMEDLHVSGHGSQVDLMLLLSAVGPKFVMPIGGTYKHLMQYRRLAMDLGFDKRDVLIPEDGEILEFRPGEAPRIVDHLDLENVMVDGLGIGDVGTAVLRDRQTIAKEGIVVVVLPIEESSGRITNTPDIISRGFIFMKESGPLVKKAQQVIIQSLRVKKSLPAGRQGRILDWPFVRKRIEENLARFLKEETGRSPLIVPVIVEV